LSNRKVESGRHSAGEARREIRHIGLRTVETASEQNLRKDFNIPEEMDITLVVGFGYPAKKNLTGKRKNRLPINELVYHEIYG
jgi:hypothetical protein